MRANNKIKLHLGCGSLYLKGYVNIDYPQTSHTTITVKADKYADLRNLDYPEKSISEIRLHHVFEHFSRQWAYRLLANWHKWLEDGGILVIETPDFDECAKRYLSAGIDYKFKLLRQIFGSHEAHWAYHVDGWDEEKFRFVLQKFGFHKLEFQKILAYHSNIPVPKVGGLINKTNFEGLKNTTGDRVPNIVVKAYKSDVKINYKETIKELLAMSMVGKEDRMFRAWLKDIDLT